MAEIRPKRPSRLLRWLLRVVHPSKRKVWTASDLAEVQGLIRFVRVFLVTVLLPGVILAWIGLRSVTAQNLSIEAEIRRSAQGLAEAARAQSHDSFEDLRNEFGFGWPRGSLLSSLLLSSLPTCASHFNSGLVESWWLLSSFRPALDSTAAIFCFPKTG